MKKCKKWDWMALKYRLLNIYLSDCNAIFSIVFVCLFYTIIWKPISYLSEKTGRKKVLKKGKLLGLSADQNFWITNTKYMLNKNGLKNCRIAVQRKALLGVYKISGPIPSGINDFRQYLSFEVQKSVQKQLNVHLFFNNFLRLTLSLN